MPHLRPVQPSARPDPRPPLEDRLVDEAHFFKTWVERPKLMGAVSPSGRFLARMMASYIDPSLPGPIIELGPGTGPVTTALLQRGVSPDRLVLVEFEASFCQLLKRRFPGVRVVQGDAFNLKETLASVLTEPAAAVVSSLPLLNTPDQHRLALLQDAFDLMRPDGCFIQFTYGIASPIPRKLPGCEPALFSAKVSAPVWLNIPPARVWCYRQVDEAELEPISPAEDFMRRLRERSLKVQTEIRLRTARARLDFEVTTRKVSAHAEQHPAMVLFRKISDSKKGRR